MNDQIIKDEILSKLNPETYAMGSSDLIDIMNEFGLSQEDTVFLYSQVIDEQREELKDTTHEVVNYFRKRGNYYPSFESFKREFDKYDVQPYVGDDILRNMHKQETEDPKQLALFELRKQIREEFMTMKEIDSDFDSAAERIKKQWGGETEPEEEFSPEEFFGDAGEAAQNDMADEYGEDDFAPFGTMEDPNRMMRDLKKENEEGEEMGRQGMFMPKDIKGNRIKLKSLVKKSDGKSIKSGRVVRYADDGEGSTVIVVDWAWPVDMKYTNPEEMGETQEYPENLLVQTLNEGKKCTSCGQDDVNPVGAGDEILDVCDNCGAQESGTKNENIMNEEINEEEINEEIVNETKECGCDKDCDCKKELDEMRGLGVGVRNSGDRNVKMRDDHAHAPLTNLSESLDGKIKTLSEGTLKRKDLINFIKEEAKNIAKEIK